MRMTEGNNSAGTSAGAPQEASSEQQLPLVSIVVSAYNSAPYIERCFGSIVSQCFRNFAVIVVDDCSTDGTLSIAQAYANKDERVWVVAHERNQGSFQARMTGKQEAVAAAAQHPPHTHQYHMFVDGNDQLLPNCIERAIATITGTGADVVHFCADPYPKPLTGEDVFRRFANAEISHSIWDKCFSIAVVEKSITDMVVAFSKRYRLTVAEDYLQCLMLFRNSQHYQPLKEALSLSCVRGNSALTVVKGDHSFRTNSIAACQPSYQFAFDYCAANGIVFQELKHIATQIPLALTRMVVDQF